MELLNINDGQTHSDFDQLSDLVSPDDWKDYLMNSLDKKKPMGNLGTPEALEFTNPFESEEQARLEKKLNALKPEKPYLEDYPGLEPFCDENGNPGFIQYDSIDSTEDDTESSGSNEQTGKPKFPLDGGTKDPHLYEFPLRRNH